MAEPGKLACRCGNTARLGETRCGRCIELEEVRDREASLWDDIVTAQHRLDPDSPEAAFAEAVVTYLNNARDEGRL